MFYRKNRMSMNIKVYVNNNNIKYRQSNDLKTIMIIQHGNKKHTSYCCKIKNGRVISTSVKIIHTLSIALVRQ